MTVPPAASSRANRVERQALRLEVRLDRRPAARPRRSARPSRRRPAPPGRSGPPTAPAVQDRALALGRPTAQPAGHRDDLRGADDEQAVRGRLAPTAAPAGDDPERHRADRSRRSPSRRPPGGAPGPASGSGPAGRWTAAAIGQPLLDRRIGRRAGMIGDVQERRERHEPDQLRLGDARCRRGRPRHAPSPRRATAA